MKTKKNKSLIKNKRRTRRHTKKGGAAQSSPKLANLNESLPELLRQDSAALIDIVKTYDQGMVQSTLEVLKGEEEKLLYDINKNIVDVTKNLLASIDYVKKLNNEYIMECAAGIKQIGDKRIEEQRTVLLALIERGIRSKFNPISHEYRVLNDAIRLFKRDLFIEALRELHSIGIEEVRKEVRKRKSENNLGPPPLPPVIPIARKQEWLPSVGAYNNMGDNEAWAIIQGQKKPRL